MQQLDSLEMLPETDEFIILSTVKLEKKLEKAQYPSSLYIF